MAAKDSIFGIQAPKFVDDESNEVLLNYFVVLKDEKDFGTIEHQSIINRHREWVDKGDHWIFEGLIHLFKYDDPEAKYLELQNYYKQNVRLYKRRDGSFYLNNNLDPVYFRLDKLEPIVLTSKNAPDGLLISFVSIEPVNTLIRSKKSLIYSNVEVKNAYSMLENCSFNQNVETEIP
ncbi:MAG: hypothetical protein KGZ85_08090 [Ignavibacterium sp.]|nr:hypothetical protein [Ignavibacterium sp.]